MFENYFFNLGRIDVFTTGFNQFFFGLASFIPQVAILIESAQVPGVVPSAAQRVGGVFGQIDIFIKNHGALDGNFSDLTHRNRPVVVVHQAHIRQRNGSAGGAGFVGIAPHGGNGRCFGLAVHAVKCAADRLLVFLDDLGRLQADNMLQRANILTGFFGRFQYRPQNR